MNARIHMRRSAWSCSRGALLLPGIFMMTLLVALLYALIGVAQTLYNQEGMQDASDAAALAAAILHARGMNLIALLNLLMALLVSVLVAIRLAQTFFAIAATVLYGFAVFWGLTSPAAAACHQVSQQLGNAYKQAKDPIFQVVEGLHELQEATKVVIPWLAMGNTMLEASRYHPPAKGAFALPSAISLPVEVDEFPVLCGRATDMAITGSLDFTTSVLPVPDRFRELALQPVEEGASIMGQKLSRYLCGSGKESPPSYEYKVNRTYPRPVGLDQCENDPESSECLNAEQALVDPNDWDEVSGRCRNSCNYDDPYESQARLARLQCAPDKVSANSFTWQQVEVDGLFHFDGQGWVEQEHEIVDQEVVTTSEPPCDEYTTAKQETWNADSGDRELSEPLFLCQEQPIFRTQHPRPGSTERARYMAAARIFSCKVSEKRHIDMAEEGDSFGGEGSEKRSPHRMEKDLTLGDEAFQIRTLAFGGKSIRTAQRGLRLGLHGQTTQPLSSASVGISSALSRFSFAQAEYYFDTDGDIPRADFLWEMRWRARLMRVRLPERDAEQQEEERRKNNANSAQDALSQFGGQASVATLSQTCSAGGSSICPSQDDLKQLGALLLH